MKQDSNLRFLILCYHGKGHFNPMFHLARTLLQKHEVLFSGFAYFQPYVTGQGFQYHALQTVPFGLGLEQWVCETQNIKPVYLHTLKARWQDSLFYRRQTELQTLLDAYRPDVVMLDTHQSTDFIVLYPLLKVRNIRIALVHTMLSGELIPGFPPVNSLALPDDAPAVAKAMRDIVQKKQTRLLIQKTRFFGMDDHTIIERGFRRNAIPAKYISPNQKFYGVVLRSLHEFIFLPKEFDFNEAPFHSMQHHVGFQIDYKRQEGFSIEYDNLKENIVQRLGNTRHKLVYCSFGTVQLEDTFLVIEFIKRLIKATANQPVELLIATSLPVEAAPHVWHMKYVPQIDVLSYASAFVTHGGLNSIKEAIDSVVPMLVYPGETVMDPAGCATRVVYHRLGLRGDMKLDSVTVIQTKIQELLTDSRYKDSLYQLRKANQAYDVGYATKLLENLPLLD